MVKNQSQKVWTLNNFKTWFAHRRHYSHICRRPTWAFPRCCPSIWCSSRKRTRKSQWSPTCLCRKPGSKCCRILTSHRTERAPCRSSWTTFCPVSRSDSRALYFMFCLQIKSNKIFINNNNNKKTLLPWIRHAVFGFLLACIWS